MRRNQGAVALVGILMTLCATAAYAADPFPPTSIAGIDHSYDLCIWRFNKHFDGNFEALFVKSYDCPTRTTQSATTIAFRVYSNGGPTCDEEIPGVPPDMLLESSGITIQRSRDDLAHYTGRVQLTSKGTLLFEGTMELMARVGTHQDLGEKCDELEHIEGWIVVRGVGPLSDYTIRATIAANGDFPTGLAAWPGLNRITGVVIKANRPREAAQ